MKKDSLGVSTRPQAGWTVIEILIGLTAIAIVTMLSAPVINGLSHEYYLKKTSSNLLSSLSLAQTEAARRGTIARLCPSSDGKSCRPDGNWNEGWIVFVDTNANHLPEPVEVVDVYGRPKGTVRIDASGSVSSSANFSLDGLLIGDHQQTGGKFLLCYEDKTPGFQEIRVDSHGLAEARKSDQDCGAI
jgi:type IV fimbrial biogenesis protein FimT